MKNTIFILIIILSAGALYFLLQRTSTPDQSVTPLSNTRPSIATAQSNGPIIIAQNLDTPWAIAFLPDHSMLVTERPGRVRFIDTQSQLLPRPITLENVKEIGEGGLLGLTLHPNFSANHMVYFYYTYRGDDNNTFNRVVRMTYTDGQLNHEEIIVDKIPGSANHNGGRIKFGPDNNLYIGTGDAENPSQAQDINTLGGKILRVTDVGKPVMTNPFHNLVYSYGHRNVQGLTWDDKGQLWATEHGRSGVLSGLDELNLIESGKNYGWPIIQGDETRASMQTPKLNSGPLTTWAPAGAAFVQGSIYFGGLRGQTLYQAIISAKPIQLKSHFASEYGRIREVILGPDGWLYFTTSNQDSRGQPRPDDDKVIKVNPQSL